MREVATKADVRDAVHTMTVRVGIMLGTGLGIAIGLLSVLIIAR